MVYRFKLVSDEVSNFSREIEIDSNSSFLQLRNAILDSVDYAKDDIDSFFLCDDEWNKKEEITLEDMGRDDLISSSDQDIWIMEDTPLNELIEEEGQKLIFVYNYLTESSFFMEMKEAIPGKTLSDPICTVKRGKAPAQHIDYEEFEQRIDQAAKKINDEDLDIEEFYGDSEFNEDELGSGFDDLSLN